MCQAFKSCILLGKCPAHLVCAPSFSRSLDIREVPNCPQVPGMGACRYNTTGKSVLGYLTGNIVEEDEGVLRLEYHNGDPCPGGGKSMVHVHFTCGLGTREVSQQTHGWCCAGMSCSHGITGSHNQQKSLLLLFSRSA